MHRWKKLQGLKSSPGMIAGKTCHGIASYVRLWDCRKDHTAVFGIATALLNCSLEASGVAATETWDFRRIISSGTATSSSSSSSYLPSLRAAGTSFLESLQRHRLQLCWIIVFWLTAPSSSGVPGRNRRHIHYTVRAMYVCAENLGVRNSRLIFRNLTTYSSCCCGGGMI